MACNFHYEDTKVTKITKDLISLGFYFFLRVLCAFVVNFLFARAKTTLIAHQTGSQALWPFRPLGRILKPELLVV